MKKDMFKYICISMILTIGLGIASFFTYKMLTEKEKIEYKVYKLEELPRIDASLITQPLATSLIKHLTNKKEINMNYTDTHQSYHKLIDNETDLIIVSGKPNTEEMNYAKEKNITLEIMPIVNEALVFFVHKNNAIDKLTLEELQQIYDGSITNWNELGGENNSILAYQRPTNSLSQNEMLSLLMKEKEMKVSPKEEYIKTMVGSALVTASYDNKIQAIGYSSYYYAKVLYGNDQIKFIDVNGISPTYETIRNQSYPLLNTYYLVIRKEETNEGKIQEIVNEIFSDRGKSVAKEAGYIPIK